MAKRPGIDAAKLDGKGQGVNYGEAGKIFPQLCSWLCDSQYEDGEPKGRVQLQLERKGGQLRCLLKVQDGQLCIEAYHESATDALLTLELLLGNDDCPWSLDPFPIGVPSKGRKK